MHGWKNFLDSLASRGGTVFVLLLLVVAAGAGILHGVEAKELLSALLTTLAISRMANGKNQPPNQPPAEEPK